MKPALALRVVPLLVAPFIVHCSDGGPEGAEHLGALEQALCGSTALSRSSASASSLEAASLPAANAIDGNPSTRWASTYSDPQWLEVDLGAERWVNRVRLSWETAASRDFDIQVRSTTTGSWTTIYTDNAGNGGVDDITGLGAKARYVRMYSRARTTQWGNSLYELEVFGDVNTSCNSTTGTVIPARIEAEAYNNYFDSTTGDSGNGCAPLDNVDTELTTDPNGGTCNVGWTTAGEWLEYDIVANSAQTFDFTARVASTSTGKTVRLELDGVSIGTVSAPSSGWQAFADRTISGVNVSAGNHKLRVVFDTGSVNLNYVNVTSAAPAARLVPARIEAESYGSFSDTTSTNLGGACAADAVDKQLTSDTGGGCNVGWTESGEWLQYAIRSDVAQTLNFTARLASASTGKTIHLELDGANIGSLSAPSAGTQSWADRTIRNVAVAAGNHTLRVVFDNGGVNFNWLDVSPQVLQSVSVNPTADAYVTDTTPNGKFGTALTLESMSATGFNTWTYLKFDLSQFSNVTSAKLSLKGSQEVQVSLDPIAVELRAVANTSWGETSIDWNTKPALGSVLASTAISAGGQELFYSFDVSPYVRAEKAAGRNVVTFALKNSVSPSDRVLFHSREWGYTVPGKIPPELVVTTTDPPLKAPTHDAVDSFSATPAAQALYQVPVVVIRYLPTRDGVNLSPVDMGRVYLGSDPPLSDMVTRIDRMDKQLKFGVEEGSRFRGYANAAAKPSLGYKIVDLITVYEESPDGPALGSGAMLPDYAAIMNRFNAKDSVENRGVKQFWIWAGYMGRRTSNESRMVSKFGREWDADNSAHNEMDEPQRLNKTYFIFHYAFMGPVANALHNHGHQYEAAYGSTSLWRHGTPDRFFVDFCGVNAELQRFEPGRAGDVHHPFNVQHEQDYDYTNTTSVLTDIEDWKPQGGVEKSMSASRWMNMPYAWPDGIAPEDTYDRAHAQWQIYWAQNFPGRGNRIQNAAGQYMTNWFRFLGDWDGSFSTNLGLFGSTPDPN